jgi:hypothetical protein
MARYKLYLLPYLTALFRVTFLFSAAPSKRQEGDSMVSVSFQTPFHFFIFCFACPTCRPGSSWLMTYACVCGDVASRCLHELCKAADTTGMQSTNVCSPQCMGTCGRLTHGPAVGIPAVRMYTAAPEFINLGYAESFPQSQWT